MSQKLNTEGQTDRQTDRQRRDNDEQTQHTNTMGRFIFR